MPPPRQETVIFGLARSGRKLLRRGLSLVSSGKVLSAEPEVESHAESFGIPLGLAVFEFKGMTPGTINPDTLVPDHATEFTLVDSFLRMPINYEEVIASYDSPYYVHSDGGYYQDVVEPSKEFMRVPAGAYSIIYRLPPSTIPPERPESKTTKVSVGQGLIKVDEDFVVKGEGGADAPYVIKTRTSTTTYMGYTIDEYGVHFNFTTSTSGYVPRASNI